jgi:hypothetical protein
MPCTSYYVETFIDIFNALKSFISIANVMVRF